MCSVVNTFLESLWKLESERKAGPKLTFIWDRQHNKQTEKVSLGICPKQEAGKVHTCSVLSEYFFFFVSFSSFEVSIKSNVLFPKLSDEPLLILVSQKKSGLHGQGLRRNWHKLTNKLKKLIVIGNVGKTVGMHAPPVCLYIHVWMQECWGLRGPFFSIL